MLSVYSDNLLIWGIGIVIIGGLSVVGNAYATRHHIYLNYLSADVSSSAHDEPSDAILEIPPVRVVMIRSLVVFVLLMLAIVTAFVAIFVVGVGLLLVLNSFIGDDLFLTMAISLPIIIAGYGFMYGAYRVSPAFVDHKLYRHPIILNQLYDADENPFQITAGVLRIFRISLVLSAAITVMSMVRIATDSQDGSSRPTFVTLLLIISMLVIALVIKRWESQLNRKKPHDQAVPQTKQD